MVVRCFRLEFHRQGAPDTYRLSVSPINNDVAIVATGTKSLLFGQLKVHRSPRAPNCPLSELSERYADTGQSGLHRFRPRYDGNLMDAGTHR